MYRGGEEMREKLKETKTKRLREAKLGREREIQGEKREK